MPIRSVCQKLTSLVLLSFLAVMPLSVEAADLKDLRVLSSVFPPYSFYAEGQPQGVAVQKLQQLFEKLGHKPDIEIYPWARAYSMVQNTPNSILFSVARTPEREEMFVWLGTIIDFDVRIYRAADRTDIQLNSEDDFTKFDFAGLLKDVKTGYLKKRGVTVREVPNEETALKMLLRGRVDLMASDRNAAEYRLAEMGIHQTDVVSAYRIESLSKPLYLIAHKDTDPALIKQLRAALAEMNGAAD